MRLRQHAGPGDGPGRADGSEPGDVFDPAQEEAPFDPAREEEPFDPPEPNG